MRFSGWLHDFLGIALVFASVFAYVAAAFFLLFFVAPVWIFA